MADNQSEKVDGALELISREYAEGSISFEQSLIYKLQSIREPANLPERFKEGLGNDYPRSATMVLREAFQSYSQLSLSGQATVASLLARPSGTYTYDSPMGWYKLHYNTTGTDAVSTTDVSPSNGIPDFIDQVAGYFDSTWQTEVINLGYRTPPSDGSAGGDSKYDIYFEEMPYYGYAQPEYYGPEPWNDATSFISMHRNFTGFPPNDDPDGNPAGAAKATAAHEFHHAIQFGYDYTEDIWLMEATSTWMEDIVFDVVNDNYNYLSEFFTSPQTALTDDGMHMYASFIWDKFLEERFDTSLVKSIWEGCIYSNSIAAMENAIPSYGYTLDSAFAEFETWIYKTGTRDDGTAFSEGTYYNMVSLVGNHSSYPLSWTNSNPDPEGMAAVFIRFYPTTESGSLKLSFDGPTNRDWDVYMIASMSNTNHTTEKMTLDTNEDGDIYLEDFRNYQQAIMIAVNNTDNTNASNFLYAAEIAEDTCIDSDGDGFGDPNVPTNLCPDDNCPYTYNPGQEDDDGDGVGDVCDQCPGYDDNLDADGDAAPDDCDNCPDDSNPYQEDSDGDSVGDSCDVCPGYDDNLDADSDGVPDGCDVCAGYDDNLDADQDGTPDGCDVCPGFNDSDDADVDGVPDGCDNCPTDPNQNQTDADGDLYGEACDCDDTDDTVYPGADELCDGILNNCDNALSSNEIDDDSDGYVECSIDGGGWDGNPAVVGGNDCDDANPDRFPGNPEVCDGIDNDCSGGSDDPFGDSDGDGWGDECDICPELYNPSQEPICGDANGDCEANVGDAVYIINYVFKSGPAPEPLSSGDANCDGECNVGDAVYMINFVFKGGPAPCAECP